MTNEEVRKAIEKYQEKHPLQFGMMLDVTAISSKEGADIISQTIERISKKVEEDSELWCICEMAKMYMQGVKPVYPVKPQGEWIFVSRNCWKCSLCNELTNEGKNFCPNCGAEMKRKQRDCEHCKHYVERDGSQGCEVWECSFEDKSDG